MYIILIKSLSAEDGIFQFRCWGRGGVYVSESFILENTKLLPATILIVIIIITIKVVFKMQMTGKILTLLPLFPTLSLLFSWRENRGNIISIS